MHPEAFKIFGFPIYWYGIFAAISFLLAFGTGRRRAAREGLPGEAIMNLAPWIIVGAIIGARLLYVLNYWNQEFAGKPWHHVVTIGRSGLVYYGGLIGASLATIIYCWKNKYPLWKVGDIMGPSVALGHAVARLGCLMTGCCHGSACSMPWAIRFPASHATGGAPVHPTQLYEAALNFLFFVLLMALYRRKKFDGQIFAAYLMGYAVLRAFVEIFRGDYEKNYIVGFVTPGQSVSAVIFAIGGALWWILSRQGKSGSAANPAGTHG